MITLYDDESSADCYRVRVLLGVLGLEFESIALEEYDSVDLEPLRPAVVLVDDRHAPEAVVHDSLAALLYLCHTYDDSGDLLGTRQPDRHARVVDWLTRSQGLGLSAGAARRHESFGEPLEDLAAVRLQAHRLLAVMDRHLWFGEQQGADFLAGAFSVADVACFGDVALCEEGGIERADYPAVRRWCDRVKRAPGVPLMAGIFPAGPGRAA